MRNSRAAKTMGKKRVDMEKDPRFAGIERFEKKIWLSSPTMHGEELTYMTEAYRLNWMSTIGKNIDEVEMIEHL